MCITFRTILGCWLWYERNALYINIVIEQLIIIVVGHLVGETNALQKVGVGGVWVSDVQVVRVQKRVEINHSNRRNPSHILRMYVEEEHWSVGKTRIAIETDCRGLAGPNDVF